MRRVIVSLPLILSAAGLVSYQASAQMTASARAGPYGLIVPHLNGLVVAPSVMPSANLTVLIAPLSPAAALAPAAPSILKALALPAVVTPEKSAATNPSAMTETFAAGAASAVFDGRAGLPSYLSVADPVEAARVADLIAAASASPTARRVLRRVKTLVERRGRPVPVEIGPTKLGGGFDYNTGVVKVSPWKGDAVGGAPALIHELLHVVQKELGLPSDAFEMELEAYATDFRLDMELGLAGQPAGRDWDRKVIRRFRGELDAFVNWLQKEEYADDLSLLRGGVRAYREGLDERRAKLERRVLAQRTALSAAQAALAQMRADGQPANELRNYAALELAPRREKLRQAALRLSWLRRDMRLLNDPASLRRYRGYSRRVMRLLRSTHAKYNAL